jgi:hypothetical protein
LNKLAGFVCRKLQVLLKNLQVQPVPKKPVQALKQSLIDLEPFGNRL